MANEKIKVVVEDVESIWQRGDKEIFAIKSSDGTVYKTWSKKIADTPRGDEIDVEMYPKEGNNGQPELWITFGDRDKGGGGGRSRGGGGGGRGGNKSFALAYAKDVVIAEMNATNMSPEDFADRVDVDRCLEIAQKFHDWLG